MLFSSVLKSVGCDRGVIVGWGKDDLLVLNLIQSSKIDDNKPDDFDNKSDDGISDRNSVENSEIIMV